MTLLRIVSHFPERGVARGPGTKPKGRFGVISLHERTRLPVGCWIVEKQDKETNNELAVFSAARREREICFFFFVS